MPHLKAKQGQPTLGHIQHAHLAACTKQHAVARLQLCCSAALCVLACGGVTARPRLHYGNVLHALQTWVDMISLPGASHTVECVMVPL